MPVAGIITRATGRQPRDYDDDFDCDVDDGDVSFVVRLECCQRTDYLCSFRMRY